MGVSVTNNTGVTPYAYAIIDEVVARLAAMTAGERRQVAAKLAQQAPDVAEALAQSLIFRVHGAPPLGMVIGGEVIRLDSE